MIPKLSFTDSPSSFVIYAFRELARGQRPSSRARLRWQRSAVCADLSSALLRAELMRNEPSVRRVQVFEQRRDHDGNIVAGRVVRTFSRRLPLFRFI